MNTKNRCAGLVVVLFSLSVFGVANADIEFAGVLDAGVTVTQIDSVRITPPNIVFLTPDWDSDSGPVDTFTFNGVPALPDTLVMHGSEQGFPFHKWFVYPKPDTWYMFTIGIVRAKVMFYGDYGGVGESKSMVECQPCLAVNPGVVTAQMMVRLQPVGAGRQVVEIHDVVGNVIRSLDCTAGTDGAAAATWNREDNHGRLVPEGVYFCRHAAADVIAVRKVLVAR